MAIPVKDGQMQNLDERIDSLQKIDGNAALPQPPKLAELKSRPCSLEELQAALVNLIELYNKQGEVMNAAINRKQDREWRATL